MTKRINYIGGADARVIPRASVIAAGLADPGVDLVWNKSNSFELDLPDDTALWLVAADGALVEDGGLDFGDMLGLTSAEINVLAEDEMTTGTLQSKLVDLYQRTRSPLNIGHKRWTFWEDFVNAKGGQTVNGYTPALIALGDIIGQNGWWVPATASVAPTWGNALNERLGNLIVGPVSTVGHWTGATLGAVLKGCPEFRLDMGIRVSFANTVGAEEFCMWSGLHDGINGVEPSNGYYLEYNAANASPTHYYFVVAAAGVRTKFDTGVVQEGTTTHDWSIRCDGAADPTFTLTYDDLPTPSNPTIFDPTNVPLATRFGPNVFSRKILGTAVQSQHVDFFGLDWKRVA